MSIQNEIRVFAKNIILNDFMRTILAEAGEEVTPEKMALLRENGVSSFVALTIIKLEDWGGIRAQAC